MQTRLDVPSSVPPRRTDILQPLDFALRQDDLPTLAFSGVIREALLTHRRPLIRGLAEEDFDKLLANHFPGLRLVNGGTALDLADCDEDEFADLVRLLLEYRATPDATTTWLCFTVATAAMGENHLWQDMGLPNRKALSNLLNKSFPALTAQNVGDMKWKKFFYRQLCERAAVPICKSPHCAECCDYAACFGHASNDPATSDSN